MKTLFALVCSLVVVASGRAQTAAASPETARESSVAPAAKPVTARSIKVAATKAPAGSATKKAAPEPTEPPAKIEGIEVPRANGGFLGVQIVNATFKLSFYDAKKKPMAADVVRAVLRWDPKYKAGKDQVVLNRSEDGKSLASPRNIRPPHLFKLTIVMLKETTEKDESAATGETYVIDFRA